MNHPSPEVVLNDDRHLGPLGPKILRVAGGLGIVLLIVGLVLGITGSEDGMSRFLFAYTTGFAFILSIALGAMFFVLVNHLTRAGWCATTRRVAEITLGTMPILAVLFLPILISVLMGYGGLFSWADHEIASKDHLIHLKAGYLNPTFFAIRWVIYFAIWIQFSRYYLGSSLRQDDSGDPDLTSGMQKWSALSMLVFALTLTFAAFDLLMSLAPHWFSTMFGVYFFAGSVIAFQAFGILMLVLLQRNGKLKNSVSIEHFHDWGKLLFAFVFFWAYIAYSQFMLIWYGNIPEETGWFHTRMTGSWGGVALILVFAHFVIPFAGLMSRHAKRNLASLSFWAMWMLIMHCIDLYWIVMPNQGGHGLGHGVPGVHFQVVDLLAILGLFSLFVAGVAYVGRHCSLVAIKEPRLAESLAFENA